LTGLKNIWYKLNFTLPQIN